MDPTLELLKALTESHGVPGYEHEVPLEIPLQYSALTGGATDGAMIHLHGAGVPTVVLGVPARHIHTHSAIIHRDDYDRALRLLIGVVERLDEETVRGLVK